MRISSLTLLLTLAFLVLASNAKTKPGCTVVYLKKFGGYLIGGCEDDCHKKYKATIHCSDDMACAWQADIDGSRCKCSMCIFSSKAPAEGTVMLTS
ncbi:hypothetical protein TRIUR3_31074 [Triticum urartu]|uniref:Uncharacterized protein n=1 Tax=Triticum urartu TaxID=4572 RepID=M8A274_TRIUA|nr:hypothetical protein TRIUR3_31074 [Triticum urartu]